MRLSLEKFEKLVVEAIESLPERIQKAVKNTAIVIEENSRRKNLLGLYEGVPENVWGKGMAAHLPDKITIFKQNIESIADTTEEVKEIVKIVVWHEIAHHFGFEEKETRRLERRWRSRIKKESNKI